MEKGLNNSKLNSKPDRTRAKNGSKAGPVTKPAHHHELFILELSWAWRPTASSGSYILDPF